MDGHGVLRGVEVEVDLVPPGDLKKVMLVLFWLIATAVCTPLAAVPEALLA